MKSSHLKIALIDQGLCLHPNSSGSAGRGPFRAKSRFAGLPSTDRCSPSRPPLVQASNSLRNLIDPSHEQLSQLV